MEINNLSHLLKNHELIGYIIANAITQKKTKKKTIKRVLFDQQETKEKSGNIIYRTIGHFNEYILNKLISHESRQCFRRQ